MTTAVNMPSGRALASLHVGDTVEITVSGQVTAGANTTGGQENGIMQYVHDIEISEGDVLKVISVEPLGAFWKTRAELESKQGIDGDIGIELINGYSTDFSQGLTGASELYRVTLRAIGQGSANVSVTAASAEKFAAGTPRGIKVGHTNSNGNPISCSYPSAAAATVFAAPADVDGDDKVDFADFTILASQWLQTPGNPSADIAPVEGDDVVDWLDLETLTEGWLAGN
jgi:hypothetical protein